MIGPLLVSEIVGGYGAFIVKNRVIHQYRFKHFSRTAIITLAIATEIDAHMKLGNASAAAYLWNVFAEYSAEAKEMLKERYQSLLPRP